MKLNCEERFYALCVFVAFILLISLIGGMDIKNEQAEAETYQFDGQAAKLQQLEEDMKQMKAIVDCMSEDLYTLLDKVVYEDGTSWEPIGGGEE